MSILLKSTFAIGFLITVISGISFAQGPEAVYPPKVNGKLDLVGLRFIIRDDEGHVKGNRPSVIMRKGFILKREIPKGDLPPPGSTRYYLAKDKVKKNVKKDEWPKKFEDNDLEREDNKTDTLIRYVRTLDDMRGFVKIRTETDALEFLRFGSSLTGYQLFKPEIQEVYCIRASDTALLPDPIIPTSSRDVLWATEEECRKFNFTSAQILNPLTPKERVELKKNMEEEEENLDSHEKSSRRSKSKRFFLIERTVLPTVGSPLNGPDASNFLKIAEEVGPDGQWRIISTSVVSPLNKENRIIVFR